MRDCIIFLFAMLAICFLVNSCVGSPNEPASCFLQASKAFLDSMHDNHLPWVNNHLTLIEEAYSVITLDSTWHRGDSCLSRGHIHIPMNPYEGVFLWMGGQLTLMDSAREQHILFDLHAKIGDTIWVPSLESSQALFSHFRVILEWAGVDTCISDSIFIFRHDSGPYSYPDIFLTEDEYFQYHKDWARPQDIIFFVSQRKGIVGFASGHHRIIVPDSQLVFYVNSYLGRLYFERNAERQLAWYERIGGKEGLEQLESSDCLGP